MKTVFPSMRKEKEGSIINTSSTAGLAGGKEFLAYTASKFAVTGMTKAAALDYAEYGIRVNSIHPGIVNNPRLDTPGEAAQEMTQQFRLLKRIAEPAEISKLVLFLASNDSSYSTGAEFVIDGGAMASV